jgi:hypothetical protein
MWIMKGECFKESLTVRLGLENSLQACTRENDVAVFYYSLSMGYYH